MHASMGVHVCAGAGMLLLLLFFFLVFCLLVVCFPYRI